MVRKKRKKKKDKIDKFLGSNFERGVVVVIVASLLMYFFLGYQIISQITQPIKAFL